jgi:hypothetical protein
MARERGQLATPLVEAGIGVLLVFAVAGTFLVGAPDSDRREARLDRYAADGLALVEAEGRPTLATALASESAFARHQDGLARRLDRLFPPQLRYRLRTPHGTVGPPRPAGVPAGRARALTPAGRVTLWVWYA